MLLVIERLFSIPWIHCLFNIGRLWRSHLALVFRRGPPSPFNLRPLTDQQRKLKADEFIGSIDTDAIRALASKYNSGLPCSIKCQNQGSFNVCFVLDFSNGTTRLVRLPIEPAVHDVWDKVRSEVYTMQYVLDHTDIPIPRVYAFGRSRLRRDTSAHQVFMVMDYIDGRPLTKKMLRNSPEYCRLRFFGEVVDIFAQLRRLEFPRGGSLMPSANVGIWARVWTFTFPREESFTPQLTMGEFEQKIVGALSMHKNELQVNGYTAARSTATTANDFFRDQYRLFRYMWQMPFQELGQQEAECEEFALHAISLEEAQKTLGLKADSPGESFCLSHPDPRVNNIIVDDELHIRGIIDWEFSVTVSKHAFLPPSRVTGYDTGSIAPKLSSEFMNVLSSRKQLSSSHSQLARDWGYRDDFTSSMAYIFLDPSDLILLFYRCIYPRLYNESRDKVVPSFFQRPENKELRVRLARRLHTSERYTWYLKDNNLFDDKEDLEWQQIHEWTTETRKKLQELREWSDTFGRGLRALFVYILR